MLRLSELKVKLFTDGADKARIRTMTAAELSLSAVKAFRDDALAAGLSLEIPSAAHAAE